MPAREPREIARRDEAAPRDIFEVAGELRPESGLERDFLAHRGDPEVGQRRLDLGDHGIDLGRRGAAHRERHMMFAEPRPAGRDLVLRSEEHTYEIQSLMRISYAVFCLTKTNQEHVV